MVLLPSMFELNHLIFEIRRKQHHFSYLFSMGSVGFFLVFFSAHKAVSLKKKNVEIGEPQQL